MSQESAPRSDQAGLLPALHRLQDQLGYIPDHAIADLARTYNVSRAEVEGVIGFYHDFRRTPPGRRRLQMCRAESCQAMGADALARMPAASWASASAPPRRTGRSRWKQPTAWAIAPVPRR